MTNVLSMPTPSALPTQYQEFIALSRYARYDQELKRREKWPESNSRLFNFWFSRHPELRPELEELREASTNLEALPSMRTMMAAGPALERDNAAAYNCSAAAIAGHGPTVEFNDPKLEELGYEPIVLTLNHPIIFDELLYLLMVGTGVGFSVERQYIAELPTVGKPLSRSIYKRTKKNFPGVPKEELSWFNSKENTVYVQDSKYGWASALRIWIVEMYNGNFGVRYNTDLVRPEGTPLKTFGGRACLTGDTILYKDRKKARGYNEITIKDLFDMQNSAGKWAGKPNHFKDVKLRSLDEERGTFYRNNVIAVVDNGEAPVYEIVTANGYRIKATGNHRFMTETGEYDFVSNFSVGDAIAVNGSPERKTGVCADCGVPISRKARRCKLCADSSQLSDSCSFTTARQRKECQVKKKDNCEVCGCADRSEGVSTLYVHHKDRNPRNNDGDNLMTLCAQCHNTQHAKEDTYGDAYAHKYVSYDEIISIEYVGVERVYDLQMQAPDHNFVANGFVSHNSGPGPLHKLFDMIGAVFMQAYSRKLTSLECHDIMCVIGSVVVVGGVRRTAEISLSNLSDDRMRYAKSGDWWNTDPHRAYANNSAVYDEKPSMGIFMREWQALYESKSGERGIINREAMRKGASAIGRSNLFAFLCNPCGEINLRDSGQMCNLSEVIVRADDTLETLKRKTRLATIWGTLQATLTDFVYLSKKWKDNCEEERLLGVSMTGERDHPVLQTTNDTAREWLRELRKVVREVNIEYAKNLGINPAAAATCVKPSGTVSQLADTASGLHTRYSPYYIRTVRADAKDPLAKVMMEQGYPVEEAIGNPATLVFSFPVKAPEGSIFRDDETAIEQLEYWLMWREEWCDHNASVTVYVKEHEWLDVAAWVYNHFDRVTGISFLPHTDHIYAQAPYQECDEATYLALEAKMPQGIDYDRLAEMETSDHTTGSQELACAGGACEIL